MLKRSKTQALAININAVGNEEIGRRTHFQQDFVSARGHFKEIVFNRIPQRKCNGFFSHTVYGNILLYLYM